MRERTPKHDAAPGPSAEPADPRAPYQRGNALLFSGDGSGAIAAYREAIKAAPKDPIGFRGLGLAYEHEGDAAKAIKSWRRYLKLAPSAADHDLIVRRIDHLSKSAKK
jgi:cytochrome c-type biogenesis protein CcmH/NrfG